MTQYRVLQILSVRSQVTIHISIVLLHGGALGPDNRQELRAVFVCESGVRGSQVSILIDVLLQTYFELAVLIMSGASGSAGLILIGALEAAHNESFGRRYGRGLARIDLTERGYV